MNDEQQRFLFLVEHLWRDHELQRGRGDLPERYFSVVADEKGAAIELGLRVRRNRKALFDLLRERSERLEKGGDPLPLRPKSRR